MRYILDIAYLGSRYAGWQIQQNAPTVQAELEQALYTLLRAPVSTTGAGRTDAGVHAAQLPVHFDWPEALPDRFLNSLNGLLPSDIAANRLYRPKKPDFHTRFDAISRAYAYRITRHKDPLRQQQSLQVYQPIDIEAMNAAARRLREYEDFASFCKAHGANKTTLCQLHHAYWCKAGGEYVFHIQANRFLRGMVRAIVGTLLLLGKGEIDEAGFRRIIEAGERKAAGPNVAARGLTLTAVHYPPDSLELLESIS